jgi:hypothetical protein
MANKNLAVQQGPPVADQQLKLGQMVAGQEDSSWTLLLWSSRSLLTPASYIMIKP